MMHYVGIDVSKHKLDCLWLRDPERLKIKTKVLSNDPAGHQALCDWLCRILDVPAESIHVIVEATSVYHEGVCYVLHAQGFQVSIVNPAYVRHYAKSLGSRSKTDKQDSLILARYGLAHRPETWAPEPVEVRQLKALLNRLSAVEKDKQREVNRLEKAQVSDASAVVIDSTERMLDHLRQEQARLEAMIDDHIDRHPGLKQDQALLASVPAIGTVMSREMVALLRSRPFVEASQAAAFVGVVPRLWESGKLKGRSTLAKNGSSRFRAKLYMAAVVAIQHNPDVRALYERLLKRGKAKMQALGAAMRKLVHICFGVLKHQSKYQPQCT